MTDSVVDRVLAHIQAGIFDDRLTDLANAVNLRRFEVDREKARLEEQARLDEAAAEIDAQVGDLLTAFAAQTDKYNVKLTMMAVDLYKTARKIGRDDLAVKIGRTVFNLNEEDLST